MNAIALYGFGDHDRSGKVRWTAHELGLEVDERRLKPGEHRHAPYTDKNPLAQVPTVEFRGQVLIESTAACLVLAESFDEPRLWVGPREDERATYLFWLSAITETLEGRLVESFLSKNGLLAGDHHALHADTLRFKLGVLARRLPEEGYLCGAQFTVADIVAGYCLRLALQLSLVDDPRVQVYIDTLRARPAAQASRVFASLDG